MTDDPQRQRKRKRLLVATIGVATVSFMGLQSGCEEPGREIVTSGNLLPGPIGQSYDPSVARDAATDAAMDALVTSGNLIAPPAVQPKDATADALIVSGNLVAPPPAARDAAADAADGAADAAEDAAADAKIVIPPSGNLMPVPPLGPR